MKLRGLGIVLLIIFSVYVIAPVYLMVMVSFSPPQEIIKQHPSLFHLNFTKEHWRVTFSSGNIWKPLRKSMTVAFYTVLFALFISIPGAYALSRLPGKVSMGLLLLIFFSRMVPEVAIALPISVTFIRWNLLDTDIGLTMAHLIKVLPITAWILSGVFKTIPRVLEEASLVDGCSRIGSLLRIVLPLSMPGIAVAAIFSFLGSWDEFTYAIYLCYAKKTLPLMVYYFANRANWFLSATYAAMVTIPGVAITYSLQKYLKREYFSGAIKG